MNRFLVFFAFGSSVFAQAPARPKPVVSPQVNDDKSVTFRLRA